MIIYLLMVINFIVIKFTGNIQLIINNIQSNKMNREAGLGLNLVPFKTIWAYTSDLGFGIALKNILGNIIPFVPMGFLIPMAFPFQRSLIKTMVSCLFLILSIEILQLIFYLGTFDVDDIILNSLSCFIGYMIFIVYRNTFKSAF